MNASNPSRAITASVIIALGAAPDLSQLDLTLASIRDQDYHESHNPDDSIEVILVLNESNAAHAGVGALLENGGSKLVYGTAKTVAEARDLGAKASVGGYIVFLDPGDVLEKNYFSTAVGLAAASPAGLTVVATGATHENDLISPLEDTSVAGVLQNKDWGLYGAGLFSRELYALVGAYDGNIRNVLNQEWEFWIRCMRHGAQLVTTEDFLRSRIVGVGGAGQDEADLAYVMNKHQGLFAQYFEKVPVVYLPRQSSFIPRVQQTCRVVKDVVTGVLAAGVLLSSVPVLLLKISSTLLLAVQQCAFDQLAGWHVNWKRTLSDAYNEGRSGAAVESESDDNDNVDAR